MISLRPKPIYEEPRTPDVSECVFYHSMDLPGESITGDWDLRESFAVYTSNISFDAKRVLDVGTATGFLSFEAEKRGASSVVSMDAPLDTKFDVIPWKENAIEDSELQVKERLKGVHNGYWYCWKALQSKARVVHRSVYDLDESVGKFDVVLAGCILLHLINPIAAMIKIASVAEDVLVVTDLDPGQRRNDLVVLPNFAESFKRRPNDLMSWWYFPPSSVARVLDVIGFDTVVVNRFPLFSPTSNCTGSFYSLLAKRR